MAGRDFSIAVDIHAPPEIVWAVMIDIDRWAEWTPSVRKIERFGSGPIVRGSRVRILQPKVPPAVWQVTELDPGRSFSWKSGSAVAWAVAKHRVEASDVGCRATLSLHFGGPLGGIVACLLKNLNNRYLQMEATGLKRRSESLA